MQSTQIAAPDDASVRRPPQDAAGFDTKLVKRDGRFRFAGRVEVADVALDRKPIFALALHVADHGDHEAALGRRDGLDLGIRLELTRRGGGETFEAREQLIVGVARCEQIRLKPGGRIEVADARKAAERDSDYRIVELDLSKELVRTLVDDLPAAFADGREAAVGCEHNVLAREDPEDESHLSNELTTYARRLGCACNERQGTNCVSAK